MFRPPGRFERIHRLKYTHNLAPLWTRNSVQRCLWPHCLELCIHELDLSITVTAALCWTKGEDWRFGNVLEDYKRNLDLVASSKDTALKFVRAIVRASFCVPDQHYRENSVSYVWVCSSSKSRSCSHSSTRLRCQNERCHFTGAESVDWRMGKIEGRLTIEVGE